MASVSGFQILRFAQLWLVHKLSESPLALGYVGMANAVPAISLNLFGGVLADKFDKRKLGDRAQPVNEALAGLVYYRRDFAHPCLAGFSRFTAAPAEMLDPVIGRIKSSIG